MTFVATDPRGQATDTTWFTPQYFFDVLGQFDIDPCTMSFRPFDTAKIHIEHDRGQDGLSIEWSGDVWLNPPYGKEMQPFVEKFIKHRKGVMLVFARMDSKFIQELVKSGCYVYCLRKRISFISRDKVKGGSAGSGSCLVFFDEKWIDKVRQFEGILLCEAK